MQWDLFIILLVIGIILAGTIGALLYWIFVQKPEMKREMKANQKKVLDYLQNTPPPHIEIEKIAKTIGIEEFTVRDILLDFAREGKLRGMLVFPDLYYDFEYCRDAIYSLADKQSSNELPLKMISKELETTKHNVKKILIELVTTQWIHGFLNAEKEVFILQKDIAEAKELRCPFCNTTLTSTVDISKCPDCNAEFKKCGVCNLIIGKEKSSSCPYCGQPSHTDHLLEWLKVKAKCPVCKHELHVFDL